MKRKIALGSVFESKIVLFFFSFILAVGAWIAVAFVVSPETTKVIRNVPVLINERDAAYKAFGLHVLATDPSFVDVTVSGARTLINLLDTDSVRVTPSYTSVEQPGTFTLNLVASRVNLQQSFSIQQISETITLTFDVESQKRLAVDVRVDGLSAAAGLMFGNVSVNPAEITISGPDAEISRVTRAVAQYHGANEELSQSREVLAEFLLYDENGQLMPQEHIQISNEQAEITIPILMRGTMELEIGFTNVPEGFDVSTLVSVLSHTDIPVAADPGVIETLGPKLVGEVDLARFEIGEEYKFDLMLPSNIINLDGIESVTVTFPKENLATKRVRVTEFRLDNAPSNYDIDIITQFINNVAVIGPQEELDELLDTSVVAVIDIASLTSVDRGERDVIVRFRISGSRSLWVAGAYHALISIVPN